MPPRLLLLVTALALALLGSSETSATNPGGNGRLVFTRMLDNHMQLFTIAADGSDERQLAPSQGNQEFAAWSPDGTKIAFWRTDQRCVFQCGTVGELVVTSADGSGLAVVARDAREPGADWSPDGKELVYVSDGPNGTDLFIANLDGSSRRLLVSLPNWQGVPSWSPDGRRIAFTSQEGEARQIYVVDTDGRNLQRLTHSQAINSDPDWSPDGRLLAWVTEEPPRADVYVMRPDGTGVRRLTFNENSADPAWSPDGKLIVYASQEDIHVISVKGGAPRRVTTFGGWDGFPDWQPLAARAADLSVFQRASASLAKPRARVFVTVLVHNSGPGAALSTALSTVVTSGDVAAVEAESGTCTQSRVVTCSLGTLAAGASTEVRLTLRAPRRGRLASVSTAVADSVDVNQANNRAFVRVPVRARR